MNRQLNKTKGFTIVELALIVALVTIVGFVGYRVWNANTVANKENETSVATEPSPIKSTADLDQADTQLKTLDVEGSELDSIEAETQY